MEAILGWVLDLVAFLLVVGFALGLLFLVERHRERGARELETLAAVLELRLRKSGHRLIPLPEDFILHERFGAGADSCRVEHSLTSKAANGLPAIFEYVTYRDRMKGQRMGYPALCLAVPAAPGTPDFRLRRRKLREWIRPPSQQQHWGGMGIGWRWVLRSTDANALRDRMDSRTLRILAGSGLWIQQAGGVLFLARTPRPWRPNRFGRRAVGHLVRAADPILRVLGQPDTGRGGLGSVLGWPAAGGRTSPPDRTA